jgi:small subunit ribosomal protein S13
MVQIFGKILNNKKQVNVALKNISGLNDYQIKSICNELNIGLDCKITDLSQSYMIRLLKLLERKNLLVEMMLKKDTQSNIKRLIEIKSHRGLRSIRKKNSFKR